MTNPTDASRLQQSRSKGGRPFFATNQSTHEVLRFEHVGEAVEAFPSWNRAHVYNCLAGRRTSHEGFTFQYDAAYVPDTERAAAASESASRGAPGPRIGSRPIVGTNVATGEERHYEYVRGVEVDGFVTSSVYGCLSGLCQQHKGFAWRYADGLPHHAIRASAKLRGARPGGGSRPVVGTHKKTGEKVQFEYIKQAATTLNIAPQNISGSIRLGTSAGGYVWAYAED